MDRLQAQIGEQAAAGGGAAPGGETAGDHAGGAVSVGEAGCNGTPGPIMRDAVLGLCVLGSGSSGNCSVLVLPSTPGSALNRGVVLIDCGFSPKKTFGMLARVGVKPWEIDDVVLTHLDRDHAHPGWFSRSLGADLRFRVHLHRRHLGRAERDGLVHRRTEVFEDRVELERCAAGVCMQAHDSLGVAAFRFERESPWSPGSSAHLGFATDLGRVTPELLGAMRGVDALAIESNYCPEMQRASTRPAFLKRRITGGAGHLSNEECADTVARISPREHAVFLHLSRECNRAALVSRLHEGADYAFTIAEQYRPTRWVGVRGRPRVSGSLEGKPATVGRVCQTLPLFG